MISLRDIAIKKKLRISMLLSAYVVLFTVLIVQITYDLINTRNTLSEQLLSIAEVVGANAQAPLIFDDKEAASQLLSGFKNLKEIQFAVLTKDTGTILASYPENKIEKVNKKLLTSDFNLSINRFSVFYPIQMDDENIGAIYIESTLSKLYYEILKSILVIFLAGIFSVIAAYFLSIRLQNLVGEPITKLTQIISRMTEKNQFDEKVEIFNQDEIGALYNGFNKMMNQLNNRDARLREHKGNLEKAIEERTHQLNQSNEALQKTVIDLNEAKNAALEAVKAKSTFLANMSHEIRTPMNGVLGMLEILNDQEKDIEKMDFIHTAYVSAEALLQIINDILDFSKIEAGKMILESIDLDLSNLVDDICTLLSSKAKEKGIELNYFIDPKIPFMLKGDPVRLRQILMNLLGNAIKFTDKGAVNISVKKLKDKGDSVSITFSVQDTGIGINRDVRKKLFSSFTQADGSTTRKFGGTGLGLTISRQLVQLMQGEIHVQSKEGKGSIFAFAIDMKISDKIQEKSEYRSSMENRRALIIDDNGVNRKILKHYLSSWKTDFQEAASAEEALAIIKGNSIQFDIIYLDMHMPEVDGFMFCKQLKGLNLKVKPIIILLNSAGEITEKQKKLYGIDACLIKPYRQSKLLQVSLSLLDVENINCPFKDDDFKADNFIQFKNKKILLVEDNLINQKVALTILEQLGFGQIDLAQTGKEAVDLFLKSHFDLILMDCQMPVMSGYEATMLIRENEKRSNSSAVPIIAMTANAMEGDKEKCIASGMSDYLSKPIKKELIIDKLNQWM